MKNKKKGSTMSGNAWYKNGGFIPQYYIGGVPCFDCGGMYDDGGMYAPVVMPYPMNNRVNMYGSYYPYNALNNRYPSGYFQVGGEEQEPQWHAEWNQDPIESGYAQDVPQSLPEDEEIVAMDAQSPMGASNMNVPQSAVAPVRSRMVNDPSIVNYLASNKIAADYASRKALAEKMNIADYRGTADQNMEMLRRLRAGEQMVEDGSAPAPVVTDNPQGDGNGATNTGSTDNGGNQMVYDPETNSWIPTAITLGTTGAIGAGGVYGLRKMYKSGDAGKTIKSVLNGLGKDDMVDAITKRGYRLASDYDDLIKAGWKPNEIMKKLKGIPFKETFDKAAAANRLKAEANFTQHLFNKNMQNFGQQVKDATKVFKNRFKTAQPIIEEITQRGVRTATDLERLKQAGLTQQEAMNALKGFKFEKVAPAARTLGQSLREGYAALRSAKGLATMGNYASKIGKYLPFEDGGEYYMQEGGWNVGGYHIPDWLKTGVQVLDPTGVSSYGDVYDAWRNPNVPGWEAGLTTLGALPVIGKIGKAASATTKIGKALSKVEKAAKYVSPVAYMDRKLPMNAAFANMMAQRAVSKAPVTRAIMEAGSYGNQGRRFFTGAGAGIDALDRMMGYQPGYQEGGLVGQEMEVSPAELKRLKAMGYKIEML